MSNKKECPHCGFAFEETPKEYFFCPSCGAELLFSEEVPSSDGKPSAADEKIAAYRAYRKRAEKKPDRKKNKKRLAVRVLCLTLAVVLAVGGASTALYFALRPRFEVTPEGVLVAYHGDKTEVTLPDSVKTVAPGAFLNKPIQKIVLNRATALASQAFFGCTTLTEVVFTRDVDVAIGSYAFGNCTSLTEVDLSDSVRSVGFGALFGCTSIKKLSLPQMNAAFGCTTVADLFGYYFYGEVSDWVPASLEEIVYYGSDLPTGFAKGLSHLKKCSAPSVRTLEPYAFYGCKELNDLQLRFPLSETELKANCLTDVPLSYEKDGYSMKGGELLSYAGEERALVLPEFVSSVGEGAFRDDHTLTSVTLSASVESIGKNAFLGCISLTEFIIPENSSLKEVGENAFLNAGVTPTFPEGVTVK